MYTSLFSEQSIRKFVVFESFTPDKSTWVWQLLKGNFGGFMPILRMGYSYKTYPLHNSKEGGASNIKRDLLTGERMYFAPLYL